MSAYSSPREIQVESTVSGFNGEDIRYEFPPYSTYAMDLMQESRILPCDRDMRFVRNQSNINNKGADVFLNMSYLETDGSSSSGMLTSDSCYTQSDCSSDTMCINNESDVCNFILFDRPTEYNNNIATNEKCVRNSIWSETTTSIDQKVPKETVNNLNESLWSGRIESCSDIPTSVDKNHNFKICFDTEFSESEEIEDADNNSSLCTFPVNGDISRRKPAGDYVTANRRDFFPDKPTVRKTNVAMLTPRIRELVGPMETSHGFFGERGLQSISIPRLQLIVNDLLAQINNLNELLLELLPQRDELRYEREVRQNEHYKCIEMQRFPMLEANPSFSSPLRESSHSSCGLKPLFNTSFPNPIRTPLRISFETKITSDKPMLKFKSYLLGLFSGR